MNPVNKQHNIPYVFWTCLECMIPATINLPIHKWLPKYSTEGGSMLHKKPKIIILWADKRPRHRCCQKVRVVLVISKSNKSEASNVKTALFKTCLYYTIKGRMLFPLTSPTTNDKTTIDYKGNQWNLTFVVMECIPVIKFFSVFLHKFIWFVPNFSPEFVISFPHIY